MRNILMDSFCWVFPSTVSILWQKPVNILRELFRLYESDLFCDRNFHQNVSVERSWQRQVLVQIYRSEKFLLVTWDHFNHREVMSVILRHCERIANLVSSFLSAYWMCRFTAVVFFSLCTKVPLQHLLQSHIPYIECRVSALRLVVA